MSNSTYIGYDGVETSPWKRPSPYHGWIPFYAIQVYTELRPKALRVSGDSVGNKRTLTMSVRDATILSTTEAACMAVLK